VKTRDAQASPAQVPKARQAGDRQPRGRGGKSVAWTERMLEALERGVKGGKWFSLIDKVYAPATLHAAFSKVRRNGGAPGVDHQTIEMFERDLEANLARLSEQLRTGTYRPHALRRKYIAKAGGGQRPLGIPTVRDRVVQGALREVIEPIFEKTFAQHSHGFRPKRGCKDALRQVDALLKGGRVFIVDADLKSYFDTIDHERLMKLVEEHISDGHVLSLLRLMLRQEVMDTLSQWTPEEGTPQGAVISPLLANIFLNPLDHLMAARGMKMVRYADDFVVMCQTREEAEEALEAIRAWTEEASLTLHPEKTRLVDIREAGAGFEFLGYRFERDRRTPRKKSLEKFKDRVRELTPRSHGHSLKYTIQKLNRTLRGWFEYFKHSHSWTFTTLDGWIRERLRHILRRRMRRGPSRFARMKWTNAYFHEQGLFSLTAAHASARQSSKR
jgi:RNA-directed DNA polymerase